MVAAALRGEAGVATHGDRLAAYRPIAGLDWTVTASVPEQSAFAAITRLRTSVFGATGLLALVLLAGLALLIRSVRHRRHAEDAAKLATAEADRAHAESDRLAAIVDSSDDAILSMTRDGVITSWNGGAERLYGYAAGDVVGEHIGLLIPPERAGEERNILHHVLAGEPLQHYETRRQRKDGSVVDVALTVSPIRDVEGQVTGASTIARDISERRRTEEEARRAWAKPSARTRPRASSSRA
ncbi:MAG: PAS domain S-box protein [Actinobacteria bacterium]|nr:PAS domain S-box protein [Actinomycetota bacterium]